MESPEGRGDISTKEVRDIISSIRYAESSVSSDDNLHFSAAGHDLNRPHDVTKATVNKSGDIYREFKKEFTDTLGNSYAEENFFGKIHMLLDSRDLNNISLKIACGTSQNSAFRMQTIFFKLEFGGNSDSAKKLIAKIEQNPFVVKSLMERLFSPTSDPKDSHLRGNMDLTDKYNISPFVNLQYVSEVKTKTIQD